MDNNKRVCPKCGGDHCYPVSSEHKNGQYICPECGYMGPSSEFKRV